MICPICKTGTLKKGEKMVYCDGYKPKKNESGEFVNEGSCEFRITFENKVFGKLTPEQIKAIVNGETVKNKKGDTIVLDPGSQFFTKITFAEKKPDSDL